MLPMHWVNGEAGGSLPANDRGFFYGDGLFETLRWHRGQVHLWDLHWQRMERGLNTLGIDCSRQRLEAQLELARRWLGEQGIDDAAARLAVSRGPGRRGYRPAAAEATVALTLDTISPWRELPDPHSAIVCSTVLADQSQLAGIKHANRLEQVLASKELHAGGGQEGPMCNQRGELICGVSANIFLVRDDALLTPPVERCGVAGTVRQLILDDLAAEAGLPVRITDLPVAELGRGDELLLTNAIVGIRNIVECQGHVFTSTRWGDTLRDIFYSRSESTAW